MSGAGAAVTGRRILGSKAFEPSLGPGVPPFYSHSIVLGGLEEMS